MRFSDVDCVVGSGFGWVESVIVIDFFATPSDATRRLEWRVVGKRFAYNVDECIIADSSKSQHQPSSVPVVLTTGN